jgi:hypothetical protein
MDGATSKIKGATFQHINAEKYSSAELFFMLGQRNATFFMTDSASTSANQSRSGSMVGLRSRHDSITGSTPSTAELNASLRRRRRSSSTQRRPITIAASSEYEGAQRRVSVSGSVSASPVSKRSSLTKDALSPSCATDPSTGSPSPLSGYRRVQSSIPAVKALHVSPLHHYRKTSLNVVAPPNRGQNDTPHGLPARPRLSEASLAQSSYDEDGVIYPVGDGSIELEPGSALPGAYVPQSLRALAGDGTGDGEGMGDASMIRVPQTNILAKKLVEMRAEARKTADPTITSAHIPNEELAELINKYEPVYETLHQARTHKTKLNEIQELLQAYPRAGGDARAMRELYDFNYVDAFLDEVYVNSKGREEEKTKEQEVPPVDEYDREEGDFAQQHQQQHRLEGIRTVNRHTRLAASFNAAAQDRARDVKFFMSVQTDGVHGMNFLTANARPEEEY